MCKHIMLCYPIYCMLNAFIGKVFETYLNIVIPHARKETQNVNLNVNFELFYSKSIM